MNFQKLSQVCYLPKKIDMCSHKKSAFTLAEVLITLAIIGVVAALTIPGLIQQHKKRVVETKLIKFYAVINDAIGRSEVDNGFKEYWPNIDNGFETNEDGSLDYTKSIPDSWCRKYLLPYLKVVKYDFNKDRGWGEFYLTDGTMFIICGHVIIFYPQAKDYKLSYSEDKDPTKTQADYSGSGVTQFDFYFKPDIKDSELENYKYHINKGVEPYKVSWDGTRDSLFNKSEIGCNKDARDAAYCTALIQLNGWKIPKDYPFKF